ncbi:hypothetical protein ACT3TS_19680, partial [Specibacter sp. AOP5-B1-6]
PGKDGMSWVVLHIPTLAAEAIMVHCHRVASAIKSDAAGRQRAADAAGGGEDCREYRTREQIRADIAAILLMGQELPANSYTNPTPNHHSNNNSNSSSSRGYGGTGGYNDQGNGAGTGGSTGKGAGSDFTSAGSRGGQGAGTGQGAGRDGRPNNFGNTPGSGSSGGFTGNGAGSSSGFTGSGAVPGGGSTGGTSGSPGSGYCNSEGPGAGGDGGVPFGEKSAFGVTLFDEEPVWAHSDPAPPRTNTSNSTSTSTNTNPETTPAAEAALPDDNEPFSGTIVPDGAGPGRIDGTSLPTTPNPGQDSDQNPGQQSGRGTALDGVGLEDVPLCGELVGDGSGYVDEIVDGIVEDRQQEYLDQLEAMRQGKVMVDPPLPRAQILLKVPFLGLVGITDEPAELVGEGVGPVPLG